MGDTFYAVTFRDPESGESTRLRARTVEDSSLGLGFVCISDFVFDVAGPLVDPTQEALAARYAKVRRLHLHIYSVLAIEEVGEEHSGLAFENDRSKLVLLRAPEDPVE